MNFRLSLVTIAAAAAPAMFGQIVVPPPYTIRVTQGANVSTLIDGAFINYAADFIGQANVANLVITYKGATNMTINAQDVTGSTDFKLSNVADLPVTLTPNQIYTLTVTYTPSTSNRVAGRYSFTYAENNKSTTVGLILGGVAPEFTFSYIPQGGNATPIANGGKISFPAIALGATSTASIVATNRGSGSGVVKSITGKGSSSFTLSGVPLTDTSVDPGKALSFNVVFTASDLDPVSGSATVQLFNSAVTFNYTGSGTGPSYSFELVKAGKTTALDSGTLITLPDANLTEKSSVVVRVTNDGNQDGVIRTINATSVGAVFTVSDLPFLPVTVPVGSTISVTVNFTPNTTGRLTGRLKIGADEFDLVSNGLGSVLQYSYLIGNASTTVATGGSVVFQAAPVGGSSQAQFVIANTGTAPANVASIVVAGAGTLFSTMNLPRLPAAIAPGANMRFGINFTPNVVGTSTATLRVDGASFTLAGTATNPPDLPKVNFETPTGAQEALTQPAVGLTLAAAYPLALSGTLTLNFNSEVFSNDPSVQFATGGRTVNFTIPANSTRAVFQNNQQQVRVQTGSVAGRLIFTPSFVTDGGINLTPAPAPSAEISVGQSGPKLLSVAVSARTASSITLQIAGYTTARSVTSMDLTFTPTAGENVQTTKITLPVESAFIAWYTNAASTPFGSLFSATIPLTLQGDLKNATQLSDTIQSIAVTIANRLGTSQSQSVSLR